MSAHKKDASATTFHQVKPSQKIIVAPTYATQTFNMPQSVRNVNSNLIPTNFHSTPSNGVSIP